MYRFLYIHIYICVCVYTYMYICIYTYIVKREYKQHLLETFYTITNSFTLSSDSDPQTIRSIMKNL